MAVSSDRPPSDDLTEDTLLGGRVRLRQPKGGYRAAIDPVLLAASVPAQPGEHVLDLGTGTGAAALCLMARRPGIRITGVEIEPSIADLATENARLNQIDCDFEVRLGDLTKDDSFSHANFDHVMANPPFHDAARQRLSAIRPKAHANAFAREALGQWIDVGLKRLRTGGTLTLIHKPERLGDILGALARRAGRVIVLPIAPRTDMPAARVIVQAVKGRRTPLALLPAIVLHEADGRFRPEIDAVLRGAEALRLSAIRGPRSLPEGSGTG